MKKLLLTALMLTVAGSVSASQMAMAKMNQAQTSAIRVFINKLSPTQKRLLSKMSPSERHNALNFARSLKPAQRTQLQHMTPIQRKQVATNLHNKRVLSKKNATMQQRSAQGQQPTSNPWNSNASYNDSWDDNSYSS